MTFIPYLICFLLFISTLEAICMYPEKSFTVTRVYKELSSEEEVRIYEGTNTDVSGIIIFEQVGEDNLQGMSIDYEACLEFNKQYTLWMKDGFGDGWSIGSTIQIKFNTQLFLESTGPESDIKTIPFQARMTIPAGSTVQFTKETQMNSNWLNSDFDASNWLSIRNGYFQAVSTITRYYRYTTTIILQDSFSFILSFKTDSAFITYINGIEIYREGLPEGNITSTTQSLFQESTSTWKSITIPSSIYFPSSILCIGIEIHAMETQLGDHDPFDIEANINYGQEDSIIDILNGNCISIPNSISCINAFDNNPSTTYISSTQNTTLTYILPNLHRAWFNGYQIISSPSNSHGDPQLWRIYGSSDQGITWYFLDYQQDQSFLNRNTIYTYYLRSNKFICNAIKIEILSSTDGNSVEFSEFRILTSNQSILPEGLFFSESDWIAYTDVPLYWKPLNSGYYSYWITPSLPLGLSLNPNNGAIYGTPLEGIQQQYILSALHGITHYSYSINIPLIINGCFQPLSTQLFITKHNSIHSNEESFSLYNSEQILIFSHPSSSSSSSLPSISNYTKCIPSGIYTLVLNDFGKNGWDSNSYVEFYQRIEGIHLFSFGYFSLINGSQKNYTLNTKFDVYSYSGLKYYIVSTIIPSSRTSYSYDDASWNSLPTSSTQTPLILNKRIILVRKTYSLSSKSISKGWILYIKSKSGILAYINEHLVYSLYVNENIFNITTTIATEEEDEYTWKTISGPMYLLDNNNYITLSFVILFPTTKNNKFLFDINFRLFVDSSIPISYSAEYNCEGGCNTSKAIYIQDHDLSTRWISNTFNITESKGITILFNNHNTYYFNKYCLISSMIKKEEDPIDWILYGIEDNNNISDNILDNISNNISDNNKTLILLDIQHNISWEDRNQKQCFYISQNTNFYKGYQFIATKTNSNLLINQYSLSELEFYIDDFTSIIIPPLSFSMNILSTYKGIHFPPLLSSSPYYTNFTISPSLPSPLSIDSSNGYINGIPIYPFSSTIYSINAYSIQGIQVNTTITLEVLSCDSPYNLFIFQFEMNENSRYAGWSLYDNSNQLIDSKNTSTPLSTDYYSFCKITSIYTLHLFDTTENDWINSKYTILLEDGTILYSSIVLPQTILPITISFNIGYLMNLKTTTWKYLNNRNIPESNWILPNYDDSYWSTSISSTLPSPLGITQYYRSSFLIPILSSLYVSMEITTYTYAGMILYINGIEINRIHLPNNINITSSTLATYEYTNYTSFSISILLSNPCLIQGLNIIAIETHRQYNLPIINGFGCSIHLISTNEYRMIDGIYTTNNINIDPIYDISKLFDNNPLTYTISGPQCLGSIYTWTYNNNRREYINKYTIITGPKCNKRHPSGWRLEGSNNHGETWTLLHSVRHQYYTTYKQSISYDFYISESYNSYRLYINECNNHNILQDDYLDCQNDNNNNNIYFQLAELSFYITNNKLSCNPFDGYIGAYDNTEAYKECPFGYKGIQKRLCINSHFEENQFLCDPLPPLHIEYISNTFTFIKLLEYSINPIIEGVLLSFSIYPSLPLGLSINITTGTIYGIPLIETINSSYIITVSNPAGSLNTTINLIIINEYCNEEGIWMKTEIGSNSTLSCEDPINYEGYRTRNCLIGSPGIWLNEYSTCQLRIPTLIYPSSFISIYRYDSLDSQIPIRTGLFLESMTISPSILKGLSFDINTGIIEGIPLELGQFIYTITLTNPRNTIIYILTIEVLPLKCIEEEEKDNSLWLSIERRQTSYIECSNGFSGIQSRDCIDGGFHNATWDNNINTKNCFIYNSEETPNENYVFIHIPLIIEGPSSISMKKPDSQEIFRQSIVSLYNNNINIESELVRILSIIDMNDNNNNNINYNRTIITIRIIVKETEVNTITTTMYTSINSNILLYNIHNNTNIETLQEIQKIYLDVSGISTEYYIPNNNTILIIIIIIIILILFIIAILVSIYILKKKKKMQIHKLEQPNTTLQRNQPQKMI
ncbi:hypothetical protein WA158_004673 [Blastocystis sp. Blastoise]